MHDVLKKRMENLGAALNIDVNPNAYNWLGQTTSKSLRSISRPGADLVELRDGLRRDNFRNRRKINAMFLSL